MTYEKTNWQVGDAITAEKLNNFLMRLMFKIHLYYKVSKCINNRVLYEK